MRDIGVVRMRNIFSTSQGYTPSDSPQQQTNNMGCK